MMPFHCGRPVCTRREDNLFHSFHCRRNVGLRIEVSLDPLDACTGQQTLGLRGLPSKAAHLESHVQQLTAYIQANAACRPQY